MLVGSTLCAAAPTTAFPMLLAGRGLQGIGCAGLLIVTKVILADKVSLEENAKNNTAFTIVGGVGYGIGPILGGHLTQVSWRWCFIINVPLGVTGAVLVHFLLRPELLGPSLVRANNAPNAEISQTFTNRISSFDFGGQFLFLFGMGLFVLAITWAGSYYPWSDIKVIIPLATGIILITAFLIWEYFMLPGQMLSNHFPNQKAMIPLKLLGTRNAGLLMFINLCTGMAMYAVYYFAELYFVLVEGYGAGKAGTNLIYYMPGLGGNYSPPLQIIEKDG
jgi:MFS family permease